MRTLILLSTLACLMGCTIGKPVANTRTLHEPPNLNPDSPSTSQDGLYFRILSNASQTEAVRSTADGIYQDILADIKLTDSIRPYSLYPLYLYATKNEYLAKSHMPEWSGGVFNAGRIMIYLHPQAPKVLAHEISHLIFWEFFGQSRQNLLWLNEGLAMHEEYRARSEQLPAALQEAQVTLKAYYMPLKILLDTATALEHKEKEAQIFYVESWLLVRFLIERGGRVGFYELLKNLKAGKPFPQALALAFPFQWPDMAALESSFQTEYAINW